MISKFDDKLARVQRVFKAFGYTEDLTDSDILHVLDELIQINGALLADIASTDLDRAQKIADAVADFHQKKIREGVLSRAPAGWV